MAFRRGHRASAAALATSLVLVLAAGFDSHAAGRFCRQLRAELAAASSHSAAPGVARKYDKSIARQRDQLAAAKKQARASRCGFNLFGLSSSKCKATNAKLKKMERDLGALQLKRRQISRGRGKAEIRAALEASGCNDEAVVARAPAARELNILAQIFRPIPGSADLEGASPGSDVPAAEPAYEERAVRRIFNPIDGTIVDADGNPGLAPPPKNLRTVCVRTCDGYYFPMSPAASLGDLERDKKSCEAACPGAEVQLFHHAIEGDGPETMVSSVTGASYADLPTAGLYKQAGFRRPSNCGCNVQKSFSVVAGNPPADAAGALVPAPAAAPWPSTPSPSVVAVEVENTSSPTQMDQATGAAEAPPGFPPGGRKVRVVGPVFLPDPEAAIDLRAPGRRQAP